MKTNYRHQKKLREQARLTRQAEKLLRRKGGRPADGDADAGSPAGDAPGPGEAAPETMGAQPGVAKEQP
jgi:hypothetical protein